MQLSYLNVKLLIYSRYLLPTSLISTKNFTQIASLKLHSKINHVLIPGYDPFWENPARWEPCTPESYFHIHHYLVYIQVRFSFTCSFYDGDIQGRHGYNLPLWTADQGFWYYHVQAEFNVFSLFFSDIRQNHYYSNI